jgi:hypothetical protein
MFAIAVAAVLVLLVVDLRDLVNRPRLLRTSCPLERPRAIE